MAEIKWMERLKRRWGLKSGRQVAVVLLVFACTGFSVLYLKKRIFDFVGIDNRTDFIIRIVAFLFIVLPLYQIILLFYGFLFGQFRFFWEFEKKIFANLFSRFSSHADKNDNTFK